MLFAKKKLTMIDKADALPGRREAMEIEPLHYVNQQPMKGPYPQGTETVLLGMGCFWGAERRFWELDGVIVTAVGYGGGYTPNANYQEVCTGKTGHTELVMVVYDPKVLPLEDLLAVFFEAHDPTQGMRQGNDMGTQYRSAIYVETDEQLEIAKQAKRKYEAALAGHKLGPVTTEVTKDMPFYFAETAHQQYLAKNPQGYCGLAGTNVPYCKD